MKSVPRIITLIFVLSGFAPTLLSQDTSMNSNATAESDAEKLLDLYQTYGDYFEGIYGGNAVGETTLAGMLTKCEELKQKLAILESDVIPVLQPFMASFAEKYGTTPGDIDWFFRQRGFEQSSDVGNRFRDLHEGLENVVKTRKASAESLSEYVMYMPEPEFFDVSVRVDQLKQWKTVLKWALEFDPNNAYANERLARLDGEIAAVQESIDREIDAASWAGHMTGFAGPGSVGSLASAALQYFRNDDEWGGSDKGIEVLAVAVTGNWQVAETDVFGRVIRWRLPVHVAITRPELKGDNVARVYDLSMVTQLGSPGNTSKSPPYDGYWVGNSWMMRISNIPK